MTVTSKRPQHRKAIALHYEAERDHAPSVTAKGEGLLAEKILDLARQSGVPIRQDADLVEVLSRLEINTEIPPETYIIVAEILAWVYRMNQQAGGEGPAQ